ncbi:hypothetical protein DL96DRAFT_1818910 [Flagelloscypha sp. PMI_526]|nr:hypothetical protein DL96DRAFT_1818910 [Flagelloscypha sp. PMI_526]
MPLLQDLTASVAEHLSITNFFKPAPTVLEKFANDPILQVLATSNDPPSEATAKSLRLLLIEARRELRRLDEQYTLALGQDNYEDLKAQRGPLQLAIHKHEKILAPVRRLPAELLQHIFQLCRAAESPEDPFKFPHLAFVLCRRWRTVVIEDSAMWARITVDIGDLYLPRVVPRVATMIQLSKNRPLHIVVRATTYLPDPLDQWIFQDAFRMLASQCYRWESIDFPISCNAGVHLAALRQKLPMLRRAVLGVPAGLEDTNGTFTATHIVDFLEVAPRLEEITLRNALPITHFRLPKAIGIHGEAWQNVRKFSTAERLDCDAIRDVLSRLPNLNVFGSTFGIPPDGLNLPSLSNAAINAKNLTTLALRQPDELGRDNSCTFDCLSRGSLPNLHHFVMPTPLVEDHLNTLRAFVASVSSSLRLIEMHPITNFEDGINSASAIAAVLKQAKNLEELRIFEHENKTLLVPSLLKELRSQESLVHLHTLVLVSDHWLSQNAFMQLVSSRLRPRQEVKNGTDEETQLGPRKLKKAALAFLRKNVEFCRQAWIASHARKLNRCGVAVKAGMYIKGDAGWCVDVVDWQKYYANPEEVTEEDIRSRWELEALREEGIFHVLGFA